MIKIGLVGVGHLGKIHLKLLQECSDFEVVGIYDTQAAVALQVAKEAGVERFKTYEQLLRACEAIDVVTPTTTHFKYAAKAIKNNKHVFIEKPVTNTLREGRELLKMEQEANKIKVQVGHVERFNPALLALKDQELQPHFIEVHRLAKFNPRGTDVSVVMDLMIHDLDIILKMVKSPVKKVFANGVSIISSSSDIANARVEFGNGCVANVTASRLSIKNMRKMRMFQKNAYVSVDFLEKKTEVVRLSNEEGSLLSMPIIMANDTKYLTFDMPKVAENNAIKTELELFASAIINNKEPEVTLQDGVNALELAYLIMDKINKNLTS